MVVKDEYLREHLKSNLSEKLLLSQKLTEENIEYLVDLHVSKYHLYKTMRITFESVELKKLSEEVTAINYLIQTTWGFEQNKKHHKFWELPGCQCPVFENIQVYPSGEYKHLSTCPIHGTKCK